MDRHSITVLVPTYQRAGMLRYCLESIALQSRIDLIKEVVVSENGPADESEFVSYSFRDRLPIRYIRQRPTVPACTHVAKLANEVQTKYVAMLADDDMWSRYHLEESMRCFERYPSIHAYFGQAVYVENETCHTLWKYSNSFLQVPDSAQSSLEDFRIWKMLQPIV
jgi:GT2 family glycosyltransferase